MRSLLHPAMAVTFCHSVKASRLILTHFSQRYKQPTKDGSNNGEDSVSTDKLVQDARDTLCKLGDTTVEIDVSAAHDFKVYQILANRD